MKVQIPSNLNTFLFYSSFPLQLDGSSLILLRFFGALLKSSSNRVNEMDRVLL